MIKEALAAEQILARLNELTGDAARRPLGNAVLQKDKATKPAGSGLMPGRVKHRAKTPKSCRSCHVVPSPKILLKSDLRLILRDRRNCYFPRFSMEFEGRFALRWGACRAPKVFKSPIRERRIAMPDMGQKECIGGAQTNNYQEQ